MKELDRLEKTEPDKLEQIWSVKKWIADIKFGDGVRDEIIQDLRGDMWKLLKTVWDWGGLKGGKEKEFTLWDYKTWGAKFDWNVGVFGTS